MTMKRRIAGYLAGASIAALTLGFGAIDKANAGPIELKGIYIGMSKQEYLDIIDRGNFTLAGVVPKYDVSANDAEFDNDRLVRWHFLFDSEHFDNIADATKDKFRKLWCDHSRVGIGKICILKDGDESLFVDEYVGHYLVSCLTLQSDSWVDAHNRSQRAARA